MFKQLINNIFLRAFVLTKYNLVLFIPFFIFLIVVGFIILPISNMAGTPPVFYIFFVLPALLAVFLSGWLNMFKKCVETPSDENQTSTNRTEDSFLLFREFFPGVGKYFLKIALGILIYFFLFNIFMLVMETVFMTFLGGFESFTPQELLQSARSSSDFSAFWENISHSDKIKLYKVFGLEAISTLFFMFLTMFWFQIIIIEDMFPLKAFLKGLKTITQKPWMAFIVFATGVGTVLFVLFIGAIVSVNAIIQLLTLIIFVYTIVYFLVLTFVYLEKYGLQEKNTGHIRPHSDGQD